MEKLCLDLRSNRSYKKFGMYKIDTERQGQGHRKQNRKKRIQCNIQISELYLMN